MKPRTKVVRAWTRFAFESDYGIGGFLFLSKENAEEELSKINTYGNLRVIEVEIRPISKKGVRG